MTRREILEHFAEETRPRERVRNVIRGELERWRASRDQANELEALNRFVERLRRRAAPRWQPTPLPPSLHSLSRRKAA